MDPPAARILEHAMRPTIPCVGAVIVALAVALMGRATAVAQQAQPADLIVTNAKVHTVDESRPQANAFAVKDGKFVAVGSNDEMNAHRGEKTLLIDAEGHT